MKKACLIIFSLFADYAAAATPLVCYAGLLDNWLTADPAFDFNADGIVNSQDYALLTVQKIVTFGVIPDLHNGDGYRGEPKTYWDPSYDKRWFRNGPARMINFAITMEDLALDFCINTGDIIQAESLSPDMELAEAVSLLAAFSGDKHHAIGNHEKLAFETAWTQYTSYVSLHPSCNDYWAPAGWPANTSYSFMKNGVHFVVLGAAIPSSDYGDHLTWLRNNLANAAGPIVVFCHEHLHNNYANPLAWHGDWQNIQAELLRHNVQAVIQAHMHAVPATCDFCYWISDVPFFNLRGNLLGPADGSSPNTDVGEDAAFYIFEILPNAFRGPARMKANIKITCYYNPKEEANMPSMNRDFSVYGDM